MKIVAEYSFNGGMAQIQRKYPHLYCEVEVAIRNVDAKKCNTKTSNEKTMKGRKLFSPTKLNIEFKKQFSKNSWVNQRVTCEYPTIFYKSDFEPKTLHKGAFREMDFIKETLGVEIQFGKYAFMVYNVCAKMTIFRNMGFIDTGIEIVLIKDFADNMSTGVSYFEQFVWDLEQRGVSNIDIPVLILGIDK